MIGTPGVDERSLAKSLFRASTRSLWTIDDLKNSMTQKVVGQCKKHYPTARTVDALVKVTSTVQRTFLPLIQAGTVKPESVQYQ
jgi:hypothetical protein